LLIITVLLGLAFVPMAQAEPVHNTLNGAVDMPNLVRFTDTLTLGVEGTKGVATNLFYSDFQGIEDDHNYEIYAKVTYTGSLINFNK
jgi:hypothetical protein